MIKYIFCIILLVIAIALLLEYDRADSDRAELVREIVRLGNLNELYHDNAARADSLRMYYDNLAQCYHEECVHLAFEFMSDTVYTLPCDGRRVEIGGR